MANITVYQFYQTPNAQGDVTWPADKTTTGTTGDSVTLDSTTRAFIVCADGDCHIQINASGVSTAASAYSVPILSSVPNAFIVAAGSGQNLKFA